MSSDAIVEFMAVPGAAERAQTCRGCGQRPTGLTRLDVLAGLASLERRFTTLLGHPEHSLRYRGPGRGSWSAMDPAAQVSEVLAAANRQLRELLGEETLEQDRARMAAPTTSPTTSAVLSTLARSVRRLTATIKGTTTEDWRRPRPDDAGTAAELVWLALHEATHHLEDAELLLDAASASDPKAGEPRASDPKAGDPKAGDSKARLSGG